MGNSPREFSEAYIREICAIYGEIYDDREEAALDWKPGTRAAHKSLGVFQRELEEEHGIHLSTTKIRKILISGGAWTTERSREVQRLFEELTEEGNRGMTEEEAVEETARLLGVSTVTVIVNLPYRRGVNGLEERSGNALRCQRYRARKKEAPSLRGVTKPD